LVYSDYGCLYSNQGIMVVIYISYRVLNEQIF
jgi:hypothetical protein